MAVKITGDCSDPDHIVVDKAEHWIKKNNHDVRLVWEIKTAGYEWVPAVPDSITSGGITFTAPPPPPPAPPAASEFTKPSSTHTTYELKDANSAQVPTPYKYDVHIQTKEGKLCAVKDPVIKNGAS